MIASVVRIILTGIISGLLVVRAGADDAPILNMGPSCDAAPGAAISIGRNKQACLYEEGKAQDLLAKNWSQYRPADKTQCVGMVSKGGPPSYVELLSCIEIMRDAAAIHKAEPEDDTDTTGSIGRRRPQVSRAPRAAYLDDGISSPKPVVSKPNGENLLDAVVRVFSGLFNRNEANGNESNPSADRRISSKIAKARIGKIERL
jgi:hypothetical protein